MEYWDDVYESVYCYFKPFLQVKPDSNILEREFEDFYWDQKLLVEHTTPIRWNEMVRLCKFDSVNTLKKALVTNPLDRSLYEALQEVCTGLNILKPYDDKFSPHQLETIVPFLANLGYNRIRCLPQWPDHDPIIVVDLDLNTIIDLYEKRYSLQTEDEKLLFANQFDYVDTFICGPTSLIQELSGTFEGFVCDWSTMSRWPH